jgi:hypothetical protein
MKDAAINMGSDYSNEVLDRIVFIVKNEFRYMPLCYIHSAFVRGSMGDLGPGRLVPRTVSGWLKEVGSEYNRKMQQEAVKHSDFSDAVDLIEYPIGTAINKKIDWYKAGFLSIKDWDKCDLEKLTERVKKNKHITYEEFIMTL